MDKFNCNSELCVEREISRIPEFELFDEDCCIDIRIDKSGNVSFLNPWSFIDDNKSELTILINDLIKKDFLPLNCEVGIWSLYQEDGESLNIIGYYDGDDFDDDPTIDYFINLV